MFRVLSRAIVLLSLLAAGCHTAYQPPNLDEPHALLKVRMVHHSQPGPSQHVFAIVDDAHVEGLLPGPSLTFHTRLRPRPALLRLGSQFFHTYQRPETRTYQEGYSCGNGKTCYRTVTRTEWVTVTVVDAACQRDVPLTPRVGVEYLIQYDFYSHGECSAKCMVQTPNSEGSFDLSPC